MELNADGHKYDGTYLRALEVDIGTSSDKLANTRLITNWAHDQQGMNVQLKITEHVGYWILGNYNVSYEKISSQ